MYDNGTKKSARCWCWNQVCQRVPKGSTVMVLIGDTDYELKEGTRRGMNVIGVDVREESVSLFRKNGGIAVCDDFMVQMQNIKPEAIIFDGLSGITKYSEKLIAEAGYYVKVIVWNGLRGRDSLAKNHKLLSSDEEIDVYRKGRKIATRNPGIHRAMLMYAFSLFSDIVRFEYYMDLYRPEKLEARLEAIGEMNLHQDLKLRKYLTGRHKPEFMTYRSKDSGQYFDAGAWNTVLSGCTDLKTSYGSTKSQRKSAAAKALLTMRKVR
jgi:hypothetical protein